MSDQPTYEEIRARAEKRVKHRNDFFQHLTIYLIVNAFVWAIFLVIAALVEAPEALIPAFMTTFGWGIAVAINAASVIGESASVGKIRENQIQHEMRREMEARGITDPAQLYEKPKRDQTVRLSDDGELIYEDEADQKASRQDD
jgi:sugar/nucleoside kinase (ribokinase family)